jgi:glycosyltransferase involved in cell wall biosynthesis
VLDQPGVDVDVLVIDDASTDGSAQVAAALAAADGRVTLAMHARNQGHIATFNQGLSRATGDYVVLLSADDSLTPGSLRRATALMEANPEVGFVYGCAVAFDDDTTPAPPRTRERAWAIWDGDDWIADRCREGTNSVRSPTVVMRRSVARSVGDYRAELPHSGDLEMWLRAAAAARVGVVMGADQANYRQHSASMSRAQFVGRLVDLQERRRAFDSFFARHDDRGAIEVWRPAAYRAMSREAVLVAVMMFDQGQGGDPAVAGLLELARELEPRVTSFWPWKVLANVLEPSARAPRARRAELRALQTTRELATRLAWHRWRWCGV